MNKQLKQLKIFSDKIEALKEENQKRIEELKESAFTVFCLFMQEKENDSTVKLMIERLESSRELTTQNHDDCYSSYIQCDFSKIIDQSVEFQREMLSRWFEESHSYSVDFKNDCLLNSLGLNIILTDDGGCYDQDSGKWIISKKDYDTQEELKEKINNWMEQKGYFPSVIRCDRYGNAFFFEVT